LRQVDEKDLEDLAVGAAVLGTGGGGNPYIGKLLAQQAFAVERIPDRGANRIQVR